MIYDLPLLSLARSQSAKYWSHKVFPTSLVFVMVGRLKAVNNNSASLLSAGVKFWCRVFFVFSVGFVLFLDLFGGRIAL